MTKYLKYWGDHLKLLLKLLNNPDGTVVKNVPANARDTGYMGSIPGSGKSPGEGNGSHSSILAWKIVWTEEPDRLHTCRVLTKSQTQLNE